MLYVDKPVGQQDTDVLQCLIMPDEATKRIGEFLQIWLITEVPKTTIITYCCLMV